MFKEGDLVQLKKEWYKEDVCRNASREEKRDWAKNENNSFIIDELYTPTRRNWGICVNGGDQIKGNSVIPLSLLELVEPKKEVVKTCSTCNFADETPSSENCAPCCGFDHWTPKPPVEPPKPATPKAGDIIEHEGKKYRLVDRFAKIGEYVFIKQAILGNGYKTGDVLKVSAVDVYAVKGGVLSGHAYVSYKMGEYLVLEPLMHEWTKEEIDESNRIIGELICSGEDGLELEFDDSEFGKNHEIAARIDYKEWCYSHPSKNDKPNKSVGLCVALCKAFGREIPKFIKGDG